MGFLPAARNVLHGMRGVATSGVTAMTAGSGTPPSSTTSRARLATIESPSALMAVTASPRELPGAAGRPASTCWAYSSAEPSPHRMRSAPSLCDRGQPSAVRGGIEMGQRVVGDHDQIVDRGRARSSSSLSRRWRPPHRHGHRGSRGWQQPAGPPPERVQVVGRHRPLRLERKSRVPSEATWMS